MISRRLFLRGAAGTAAAVAAIGAAGITRADSPDAVKSLLITPDQDIVIPEPAQLQAPAGDMYRARFSGSAPGDLLNGQLQFDATEGHVRYAAGDMIKGHMSLAPHVRIAPADSMASDWRTRTSTLGYWRSDGDFEGEFELGPHEHPIQAMRDFLARIQPLEQYVTRFTLDRLEPFTSRAMADPITWPQSRLW